MKRLSNGSALIALLIAIAIISSALLLSLLFLTTMEGVLGDEKIASELRASATESIESSLQHIPRETAATYHCPTINGDSFPMTLCYHTFAETPESMALNYSALFAHSNHCEGERLTGALRSSIVAKRFIAPTTCLEHSPFPPNRIITSSNIKFANATLGSGSLPLIIESRGATILLGRTAFPTNTLIISASDIQIEEAVFPHIGSQLSLISAQGYVTVKKVTNSGAIFAWGKMGNSITKGSTRISEGPNLPHVSTFITGISLGED